MSPTMFLGRVVLPVVGLVVAIGLMSSSLRTMTARTEVIKLAESSSARARVSNRINAEGRVVAYPGAEVTVGTEVLGTIMRMPAHEQAAVRKGDLLVELRDDDVKASLREAHFRLIEAETGLRLLRARYQLDRIFGSAAGKAPPADSRTEEQAVAGARRDAARAAVDRLEAEAGKFKITAPIDGVIIACQVDPGETVTPGSPLMTIVNLSRLRVEAEVDELDIPGIAQGASATITAEGYPGRAWQGQVEEIPDAIVARHTVPEDPGRPTDTRVLRLKVALRQPNPLKLGQHVQVDIVTGQSQH